MQYEYNISIVFVRSQTCKN